MPLQIQLPPIQADRGAVKLSGPLPRNKVATLATATTADIATRKESLLAAINTLIDPPGLDAWLKAERPGLLARGRELFAAIDQALTLPDSAELERALVQLTAHHRECCQQYQLHLQNAVQGVLEGPPMASGQQAGESPQSYPLPAQKACWTEGPRCPYCQGTWQSEAALVNHRGQCPLGIERRQ
jgi:hypothetical protein